MCALFVVWIMRPGPEFFNEWLRRDGLSLDRGCTTGCNDANGELIAERKHWLPLIVSRGMDHLEWIMMDLSGCVVVVDVVVDVVVLDFLSKERVLARSARIKSMPVE